MTSPHARSGIVRRRVVIQGLVQGVGFRASCFRRATDAGLGGWVRNTEEGDVEAVFEGPPDVVDALVEWCRRGPSWARVDHIEVSDLPPRGDPAFAIR